LVSATALLLIGLRLQAAAPVGAGGPPDGGKAGDAYARSLALIESALARRPGDARLLGLLADVHFRRGRFREAIAAFEEAARRDPRSPEYVFGLADAWLRLEDHDRALSAYRAVLAMLPRGSGMRARRGIAEVHYRKDRHAEAAAELRAAIEEGDESADARYELGRALDAQARAAAPGAKGRDDAPRLVLEAIDALSRAIEQDPKHYQSFYLSSTIHRRRGDHDAARKSLDAYRKWRPPNTPLAEDAFERSELVFEARTEVRLARVLFESGAAEDAMRHVQGALRIQPDFVEALAYEGWIHLRLGRLPDAARSYEKVLSQEPDHVESLWNLGKVHIAMGDLEKAASLILRATEIRRSFAEGWDLLAKLAGEGGVYRERAEEFARNALRLRPAPANYARLAEVLFARGSRAEAKRVLDEGIARYPSDEQLRWALDALLRADGPRKE
jgi:tetratricopeptide (TPR) repeat protein